MTIRPTKICTRPNYTSVLTKNLFLEGQYSRKVSATMDTGSRFTDLVNGTPISDRSKTIGTGNPRFNSPTFCAVCGGGWLEHRDNWDWFIKVYVLPVDREPRLAQSRGRASTTSRNRE